MTYKISFLISFQDIITASLNLAFLVSYIVFSTLTHPWWNANSSLKFYPGISSLFSCCPCNLTYPYTNYCQIFISNLHLSPELLDHIFNYLMDILPLYLDVPQMESSQITFIILPSQVFYILPLLNFVTNSFTLPLLCPTSNQTVLFISPPKFCLNQSSYVHFCCYYPHTHHLLSIPTVRAFPLISLPASSILSPLQFILHSATWAVFSKWKSNHILFPFKSTQWFFSTYSIKSKFISVEQRLANLGP